MKKIKSIFPLAFIALFTFTSCNNPKEQAETTTETAVTEAAYNILPDNSSLVTWKGVMLGIKEHTGTVAFKEGSLTIKNNSVAGGSFTVDLTSITPTDANYDAKSGYGPEKLVQHLQSPDFFDVANYPTATFVINSAEGNTAKGVLTVRGKSNEETLTDITVSESEGIVTASGKLTFDRKKYGVAFDMPAKDMVISNDIELNVTLKGKK